MFSSWLGDADEPASPASVISLARWGLLQLERARQLNKNWRERCEFRFGSNPVSCRHVWQLLWVACQSSACCSAWITITCFGFIGRMRSPNLPTNSITLLLFIALGPAGRLLQCRSGGIGNGSVFLSPSFWALLDCNDGFLWPYLGPFEFQTWPESKGRLCLHSPVFIIHISLTLSQCNLRIIRFLFLKGYQAW